MFVHHLVIGWKEAHLYAVEDSVISVHFGANRGAAESRYLFRVEYVANEANVTLLNQGFFNRLVYHASDLDVEVRLPKYSTGDRYSTKNTTLRTNLEEAQFIRAQAMGNQHLLLSLAYRKLWVGSCFVYIPAQA